jgi:hypothetical protein
MLEHGDGQICLGIRVITVPVLAASSKHVDLHTVMLELPYCSQQHDRPGLLFGALEALL